MPPDGYPDHIAFIGAGNMAQAIIGGLLQTGFPAARIVASDPSQPALDAVAALGVDRLGTRAADVLPESAFVVLAIKPQVVAAVAQGLTLGAGHRLMSIAAGIDVATLTELFGGGGAQIIRCMPNTPALVGCGATGLYADPAVSPQTRAEAEAVMGSVGTTLWVDNEHLIDSITALSGSGPAYYFAFMEAMIAGGEALGLSREQATALTLQTAVGAATLASGSDVPVMTLRQNVTSPGGTTQRALESFAQSGLADTVMAAMAAAQHRAQELSEEFK